MQLTSDSDRITRDYFDSLLLETRYVDAGLPSTAFTLFGESFETPIMTAALSHLNGTAPDGMVVYAKAARMSGAVHWIGMGDEAELEAILATGARTIKIIKPHADNDVVFKKIEHAVSAGCFAVGMDIDHAFNSEGGYDRVFDLPMKAKSESELSEFVKAAGIPFIAKGVLSARDAEKCVRAGCAGLVVSHHHGMIRYSVPPLMMLPEILSAVGHSVPVFVDCGIESGMDAYKCLALGATAVSVGRHLMPLLKAGPEAVAARINEMTAELAGVMARTGVASLDKMDPTVIHKRNF
jgi:isopentenyl diphosphate isomerase/L-lactate dehydrogenase-like FMN-dependent dehydrogenase